MQAKYGSKSFTNLKGHDDALRAEPAQRDDVRASAFQDNDLKLGRPNTGLRP